MKRVIYLDNSATTPVREEVVKAMEPYWNKDFGNPGSITKIGVKAKETVENCRKTVATCLNTRAQDVIFTSGGTESNNLAILGVANNLDRQGIKISSCHFIYLNIDHSSVGECFKELKRRGAEVDCLEVDPQGIINLKDLRKKIKTNTVLVSIGYANNEIGVIQPIKEIAREIRHARKIHSQKSANENYPFFHTDASQAGLYLNLNVEQLGVDLLTLDAQKLGGPKGIGALYIRPGVELAPLLFGAGQERGLRPGTANVPLLVGIAKTLEITRKDFTKKAEKIKKIRDYFWQKIQKEIPTAVLNGDLENRLPHNLNISIPGIDAEFTVLCLDEAGIICSTRSACFHAETGSAIVRALGQDEALSQSALRFSLGEDITKKDINYVVATLMKIVKKQLTKQ